MKAGSFPVLHVRSACSCLSSPTVLTRTPAGHSLLAPSVAVCSQGTIPSSMSSSQAVSEAQLLIVSSTSPKTWQAQVYETKYYTSQRVRLTGCWVVLSSWDHQVWAPKSRTEEIQVSSGARYCAQWCLHTIPLNPLQSPLKVGFFPFI